MSNEILDPRTCISDKRFQDWLSIAGVLVRSPEDYLPPQLLQVKQQRSGHKVQDFWTLLVNSKGYIVDHDTASRELWGRSGSWERQQVTVWSNHLERRLQDPSKLFKIRGLGWAFGLEDFFLNLNNTPLVYRLWQELGRYVPLDDLASVRHGHVDYNSRIDIISNLMSPLRMVLAARTRVSIKYIGSLTPTSARNGELFYMMSLNEEAKDEFHDARFPPYLKIRFQDWLASKNVGLLERVTPKENIPKLDSYIDEPLTLKERQLAEILERYQGYIVPYGFLSEEIYDDVGEAEKLRTHIKGMRRKIKDPTLIYTAIGLGWGYHVNNLRVQPLPLSVLNRLWGARGKPVLIPNSLEASPGSIDYEDYAHITRVISELRELLSASRYRILTTREARLGESSYSYSLVYSK